MVPHSSKRQPRKPRGWLDGGEWTTRPALPPKVQPISITLRAITTSKAGFTNLIDELESGSTTNSSVHKALNRYSALIDRALDGVRPGGPAASALSNALDEVQRMSSLTAQRNNNPVSVPKLLLSRSRVVLNELKHAEKTL